GAVTIRSDWMIRITEVVDWALDEGMFVILNTHNDSAAEYPVDFIFPLKDTDVDQGLALFRAIWRQIAENFKFYPAELIFEGLNEPSETTNGVRDWDGCPEYYNNLNKYYQAFVDEVRATGENNAKRFLICNTYFGGGTAAQVNGLTLPADTAKDKLIVGFHSYNPSSLCLPDAQTTWDGDTEIFTGAMNLVYNKFGPKGVPAIISEFGIMNKDNMDTRTAWSEAFVREAKKRGMPCIWWDNGAAYGSPDEELLGFYDRDNDDFFFPELLDALKTGAGLTE
ncbi:MAG: glycoside hydrolase family 5 protein, partial [Treponema sp.]|nr:glycoside hydrolase family 5 protein [Treponema sp.]